MQHKKDDSFYLFETTTAQLCGHMQHIEESGDSIVTVQYQGGPRHWWIVCRKGATPSPDDRHDRHLAALRQLRDEIRALNSRVPRPTTDRRRTDVQ